MIERKKKGRKKIEGEQFGIELKISAHLPFLWHDEAITFNLTITNRQTIDGQTDALADARKGHTLFRESRMRKMEKKDKKSRQNGKEKWQKKGTEIN